MPPVNQELIAQRLNLSRATVSRSLANHPAISTETRRRVQEMAAKLGYQQTPGRSGRRGKNSRTMTIGVLIGVPAGNVVMATFPYILKGIRERAEVEHVKIDVHYQAPGDFHPESSRQPVFRHIRGGDWRGTILIYPFAEAAVEMVNILETQPLERLAGRPAAIARSAVRDHRPGAVLREFLAPAFELRKRYVQRVRQVAAFVFGGLAQIQQHCVFTVDELGRLQRADFLSGRQAALQQRPDQHCAGKYHHQNEEPVGLDEMHGHGSHFGSERVRWRGRDDSVLPRRIR